MNLEERVDVLHARMVAEAEVAPDVPLAFVMVICNGCGRSALVGGEALAESGDRATTLAKATTGWQFGGPDDEADFCPGCVARAL